MSALRTPAELSEVSTSRRTNMTNKNQQQDKIRVKNQIDHGSRAVHCTASSTEKFMAISACERASRESLKRFTLEDRV